MHYLVYIRLESSWEFGFKAGYIMSVTLILAKCKSFENCVAKIKRSCGSKSAKAPP